jgi:hypothetical protein
MIKKFITFIILTLILQINLAFGLTVKGDLKEVRTMGVKEQSSTPTTPDSGFKKFYCKTDDKCYLLSDATDDAQIISSTTGIVPVSQGGTNTSSFNPFEFLMADATGDSVAGLGPLTNGQIFIGRTGLAPLLSVISGEATMDASGDVTLDNNSVTGKVLTGFTSGAGTVAATDTILEAIEKLDGNSSTADISQLANGMSIEQPVTTIVADTGQLYFEVEADGSGDITYRLNDALVVLDATTGGGTGGKARVALTEGTATSPQTNYLYVVDSGGGIATLTASTSLPTGVFGWVGKVAVPDDVTWATTGAYLHQRYTDALSHQGRGGLSYEREKIRALGASYEDGVVQTLTITTNVGVPDDVIFTSTSGVVYQLHRQTFPAFSGTPTIYVVNHPTTPYLAITDLADILVDKNNNSLSNTRFNFVIFGAVNRTTGESKLYLNLPNGSYSTDSTALADTNNTAITTVPAELKGVSFIIARVVLRHQVVSGGTWTNLSGGTSVIDLRGLPLGFNAGNGSTSSTDFSDAVFSIFDDIDPTKTAQFQASGITTGTNRTYTFPDANGTLLLQGGVDLTSDVGATILPSANGGTGQDSSAFTGLAKISAGVWSASALVNADVSASAAIDATKIHDGSVDNTEFKYLDGVTSNIQTQIDGKLTNSGFTVSRIPYANDAGSLTTNANLTFDATNDALNIIGDISARTEGEIRNYDGSNDNYVGFKAAPVLTGNQIWTLPTADGSTDDVLKTDGSGNLAWTPQTGGGGDATADGGLDIYFSEDFEAFDDTSDFTCGNNATFNNGGTPAGTLSIETSAPIAGAKSLKFVQTSGSLNDWCKSSLITLDDKQKGNYTGVTLYFTYDGTADDIAFIVHDSSSDTVLNDASTDVFTAESNPTRFAISAFIPENSGDIDYGFHVKAESSGATLVLDDIEFTTNPFVYKNLSNDLDEQPLNVTLTNFGNAIAVDSVYTRTGQTMNVRMRINIGATLPTGNLTFSLDDFNVDETNFNSTGRIVSVVGAFDSLVAYDGSLFYSVSGNNFTFYGGNGSGIWNATTPFTFAENDSIDVTFSVPIDGWTATSEHIISPATAGSQTYLISQAGSGMTDRISEVEFNLSTASIENDTTYGEFLQAEDDSGNTRTKFVALKDCIVTVTGAFSQATANTVTGVYKNGAAHGSWSDEAYTSGGRAVFTSVVSLAKDDYITIYSDTGIANAGAINWISMMAVPKKATLMAAIPPTNWQTKTLSAHTTSTGVMSDLTFSNLTIGSTYRVTLRLLWDFSGGDVDHIVFVQIKNGSTLLSTAGGRNTSATDEGRIGFPILFEATDTTVTFDAVSNTNARILGTGTGNTAATLEELPNHKATTRW